MSYGDTWSVANNSLNTVTYQGIDMSSDGQKIIAVSTSTTGAAQISTDGGAGWAVAGIGAVTGYGCACADDFSRLYVATNTALLRSTDGGASFQSVLSAAGSIQKVACSADGMIVYVSNSGGTTGQMFRKSIDGGNTWAFIDPSHTGAHYNVSCSDSGQYVICSIQVAPYAIKSNDYGATWSDLTSTSTTGWSCMSANGQHQYLAHPLSSTTFLLQSHDYGATWTDAQIGGSGVAAVSCSADGRYVVVSGGTLQSTQIFASTNFGSQWAALQTGLTQGISNLQMSDSGQLIVAASNSGYRVATCNTSLLSIISIEPASGPIAGGTEITIAGTGFESGAVATVGGLSLTGQTVVDQYTITGLTQAHAVGAVDVVVTNP